MLMNVIGLIRLLFFPILMNALFNARDVFFIDDIAVGACSMFPVPQYCMMAFLLQEVRD
jgi:hypothetical protein